jgi:hypothetical protein
MTVDPRTFEQRRKQLLAAIVEALEGALPPDTPARTGAYRGVWDALADHLRVDDVRPALRSLARGPGGELTPTAAGNVSMCSAESSALIAVNFLAPFAARAGLLGRPAGSLQFERELRVSGVRARVGPTLDAVHESAAGTLAFEAKTAEPWRAPPPVAISPQYDEPARRVSAKTLATLLALRDGAVRYRCLDAAQLVKHLLGAHSALSAGALRGPASLLVLFWRPSEPGGYADLFDLLNAEVEDFAGRLDDQPIRIIALSTSRLLDDWSAPSSPEWLSQHAAALKARYDIPLGSGDPAAAGASPFAEWSRRWLAVARYGGREVPDLERRIEELCLLWREDIPAGWERPLDPRLIDPSRRYLRVHQSGHPRAGSEHDLECQILAPVPADVPTYCLGARLIDASTRCRSLVTRVAAGPATWRPTCC